MTSLHQELDDLIVEYLENVDAYLQERSRIGTLLADAFINLAHAKYTMGPQNLTSHQYDKRMQATCLIEIDNSDELEKAFYMKLIERPVEAAIPLAAKETENNQSEKNHLRRRKTWSETDLLEGLVGEKHKLEKREGQAKEEEGMKKVEKNEKEDKVEKRENKESEKVGMETEEGNKEETEKARRRSAMRNNPINWFGVLTPHSLRISQVHFKKALHAAVNVANLHAEIVAKEKRIRELRASLETLN
ncbi:uncharacterized protein VTP21DRAFT_2008 [Calcarisporiella thermophila]|uniref:uncharacterized protein n=1 Tax=Calcarisporiella thermophila TaxID=911321 RepID=UPI003742C213